MIDADVPTWALDVHDVAEPFRSDRFFWQSVAASADALLAVALATGAAGALVISDAGRWWALLPFVVPMLFAVRASRAGRASSRTSRAAFAGDLTTWREAERRAVAHVFRRVLLRNRLRHR